MVPSSTILTVTPFKSALELSATKRISLFPPSSTNDIPAIVSVSISSKTVIFPFPSPSIPATTKGMSSLFDPLLTSSTTASASVSPFCTLMVRILDPLSYAATAVPSLMLPSSTILTVTAFRPKPGLSATKRISLSPPSRINKATAVVPVSISSKTEMVPSPSPSVPMASKGISPWFEPELISAITAFALVSPFCTLMVSILSPLSYTAEAVLSLMLPSSTILTVTLSRSAPVLSATRRISLFPPSRMNDTTAVVSVSVSSKTAITPLVSASVPEAVKGISSLLLISVITVSVVVSPFSMFISSSSTFAS